MISGARQGKLSGLRQLVASAMARDPGTFVVPGHDIAWAHGLDLEAAGLQQVASPRHASVLLVIGDIPPALREAAAVIYAQMMRPRIILALGSTDLSPLPAADIVAGISQQELANGVHTLRAALAKGAFHPDVSDFDAPVLQIRIEYTCSMHPEIIRDEPGSCPKCGMTLIQREAQATAAHEHTDHPKMKDDEHAGMDHSMQHETPVEYTCPMHPEVVQNEPGSCPKCGMDLEPREEQADAMHDHQHMDHDAAIEYTCPMHPEVVQNEPGSCPKCGMNLEPLAAHDKQDHAGMDHSNMDHSSMDHSSMDHSNMEGMAFMSMIDVTKDLPRSGDGLPMEWIEAPFGPFLPGLPGGLLLTLTLDGDTVAAASARSLTENTGLFKPAPIDSQSFIEQLSDMNPLAPVSYRLLACRALEDAAGIDVPIISAHARIGALERERITSHLGWLALFGQQTGFDWLTQRAAVLQRKTRHAGLKQISALKPALQSMIKRLLKAPLLKSRTVGIGKLTPDTVLYGPVARACGINNDARSTEKIFTTLGFKPARRDAGDVLARLHIRLDEIMHSISLIEAAGAISPPAPVTTGTLSGTGKAVIETPRGMAGLQLTLQDGQVATTQLHTPSTSHVALINPLLEQQALGDALTAVCSLDLSPWEIQP